MFNNEFVSRVKVEVVLTLNDGTTIQGSMFAGPQQRLIDTMNDSRVYIPIELEDGGLKLVNKYSISTIAVPREEKEEVREKQSQGALAEANAAG